MSMNNPQSLLIVEDNIDTQRALRVQLFHRGYEVTVKDDGQSALEWLATNTPDLVILDLMLPDMSGYDVCAKIRQRSAAGTLPILMLSALGYDGAERAKGLQAGANDFLGKPYTFEELNQRILKLLTLKQESDYAEKIIERYVTPHIRREVIGGTTTAYQQGQAVMLVAGLHGLEALPLLEQFTLLKAFYEMTTQVIERHDGTVFDVVGPTLAALFNLPTPVPVPPHLVVKCALELHRLFAGCCAELRQAAALDLAIGIDQGEALVGSLGTSTRCNVALGRPVESARRLMALAQAGEIVISERVYQQVSIETGVSISPFKTAAVQGDGMPLPTIYVVRAHDL